MTKFDATTALTAIDSAHAAGRKADDAADDAADAKQTAGVAQAVAVTVAQAPAREASRQQERELSTMETSFLRRFSPRRRDRWADVRAFDERVAELEQRHTAASNEIAELQRQLDVDRAHDREALAEWVADPRGSRPEPVAPATEGRLRDVADEHDALALAIDRELERKASYVAKHRSRLIKAAQEDRRQATNHLNDLIGQFERARADVIDAVRDERWATDYPAETASGADLGILENLAAGRRSSAIPAISGILVPATSLFALMRDDADALGSVLEVRERPVDPHEQAIWETSDEGRQAVALANQRVAEGLRPRHVAQAGWADG